MQPEQQQKKSTIISSSKSSSNSREVEEEVECGDGVRDGWGGSGGVVGSVQTQAMILKTSKQVSSLTKLKVK